MLVRQKDGLPGAGRLPRLYYLTERGAALVAQMIQCDPKAVFYPHGVVSVRHDLLHRIHCVDVEISVRQWADAHANMVNFYLHYFIYTGANRGKANSRRHSVVRIEVPDRDAIIPDAVFRLQDYEGHERLFALDTVPPLI